jgi:hypothetical protein
LADVYQESQTRGYHFDKDKFNTYLDTITLTVTRRQKEYEMQHLLKKLKTRDLEKYHRLLNEPKIEPHPLFKVTEGEIEEWEIV